ncbi:hypothetical protein Tco_1065897 [Tanacetum coccineum]
MITTPYSQENEKEKEVCEHKNEDLHSPEASGILPQKRKKPKTDKTPAVQATETPTTKGGSHSSLDEGTRKSQLLPEGKTTDPKDSRGNVQPVDKGLPSTVSDKGTGKTKPLPEGPHEDKDSRRLKLGITNPSFPDQNKGKTSSKVEPDSQTLVLTTAAEVQALFLFDDDLDKSEDDEFEVGDEIDEDIQQVDKEETDWWFSHCIYI